MKRWVGAILAGVLMISLIPTRAVAVEIPITSKAAVLMEKTTGEILFAKNEHEAMPPASVTKVMTLLLTMEAIDSGAIHYDDMVQVSAYASSMGGSQVFLSEGEQISVEELIKSVCVSSGNDAAVALAEYVCGVTELFVEKMNLRAKELGMNDTHFVNCTGLTAEGHVTSAYDIALMSRELILHHPDIRNYTTIWMDTIRNGTFGLSNTNKLVRFYDGCTGLKTGYTAEAGYCISATAERDGMELIATIMHGATSDSRNTDAKALLNYGFSTYSLTEIQPETALEPLPVIMGTADAVPLELEQGEACILLEKRAMGTLEQKLSLPREIEAPVAAGQKVGELTICNDGAEIKTISICAAEEVSRLTWGGVFTKVLKMAMFRG